MTRGRSAVGVLAATLGLLVALAPVPAAGAPTPVAVGEEAGVAARLELAELPEWTLTPCIELTDSIIRLYSAYFLRLPDRAGYEFWLSAYSGPEWNLDRVSAFFAESPEFDRRYGDLDDATFVEIVYRNVMGRRPDAGGRAFWLGRLRDGMARGTLMLYFSESQEYVERTETVRPLAGYLRWYPRGSVFRCGWGSADPTPSGAGDYFDALFFNAADSSRRVMIRAHDRLGWFTVRDADLAARSGWVYTNQTVGGIDAHYFRFADDIAWTLVEYPTPMPVDRPGWGFLERPSPRGSARRSTP